MTNPIKWLPFLYTPLLVISVPRFDPSAILRQVLVPADAAVDSIIYRLRADDPSFDYPLVFTLETDPTTVSIETLNCTRFNSICQANVILKKKLEPDRFYDFVVSVRNQRGQNVAMNCSFKATNATTPIEKIFPGAPTLITVSEKARRNTELGSIIAKGNPAKEKGVLMELWGSPKFGLYQKLINARDSQATIVLLSPLDYETMTVHHLTILANDPWTEMTEDTRNIASWPLLVAVLDEQDTPPVFTIAPPTTTLSPSLLPGDIVTKVHAEDGDRGKPRDIRYGLVPEGNPFTAFFNISEETGELRLVRPLSEILAISHSSQPILLTVIAEEVRTDPQEPPAQSSTVSLAFISPGQPRNEPVFGATDYTTILDENAPIGTPLNLPQAEIITQNVLTLELVGHNGTFDITPTVVDSQTKFQVKVRDPKLLDYELWHSVKCYIVAKELGAENFTARASLEVLLNDVNDNPPQFSQEEYQGSVQEGAPVGTTVLRVEATDVDRDGRSRVEYIGLKGAGSEFFALDSTTGVITVNSPFLNAEETPILNFLVEAADEDGQTSSATISISLIDVNDEKPKFEKNIYEFILNKDKNAFTTRAFIVAIDKDITSPNNEVRYELINPIDNLHLNDKTGELTITNTWNQNKIVVTKARAWDGGVPRLTSECEVRIYPPDSQSREVVFIFPGKNLDREYVRKVLTTITGAKVDIEEIRPFTGPEPGATDISKGLTSEKSVVVATLTYNNHSVVDVNTFHQVFDRKQSSTTAKAKTGGNLLWLLILFIVLALLLALTFILCCICQGCPLYVPPKRRKIASTEIKKIVQGSGQGRESKSVQVAEWFGRREAWTPEHVDNEAESLQRHEQERGSDRSEVRRGLHRQQQLQREPSREQLYIREGNTDILRLITRGNDTQRPVTLVQEQGYINDSGKDILLRRFIDQQQAEVMKSQVNLPNAVNKLQTEHELLEASLRQQNALLRQILADRERDLRLETQSLPAGTQTDRDAGTQTEPQHLRPPRRRVRSDNDASDGSDEELMMVRARARRRHRARLRKIKTPIQEESEIEVVEKPQRNSSGPKIRQTKTSELRQKNASSNSSKSIRKEVLREISASLDQSDSEEEKRPRKIEYYSEDSLEEDISPRSEKTTDSGRHKYHSETDLRMPSSQPQMKKEVAKISQSSQDLTSTKEETAKSHKPKKKMKSKRTSRYMEWYTKNGKTSNKSNDASKKSKSTESTEAKEDKIVKETVKKISSRLLEDTESSARKKVDPKTKTLGPEHPLLQHSEHRFEVKYPTVPVRKPEEDADSGIALTRLPIAQKKSVFTIAYDDMHTSQLRPDSKSPPL